MKTSFSLLTLLCILALLSAPLQLLQAFDNAPEATTPDLSLAFPLEQRGEQVVNSEDVLLNSASIVPAGSVFLTIFVPPRAEDLDVKKKKSINSQDIAYSRRVQLPDKKSGFTPEQQVAYDRATKAPWKSQMVYRAAMKQYRFDEMRFVYITPGASETSLEAFNLPDGMFLGSKGGQTRVLAVQKDTAAAKAGLTAGVALVSVNGKSLQGGLDRFQSVYYSEKKMAQDANKALELTVEMPNGGGVKTFVFAAPPKLDLNDFFSAADVSKEPPKAPSTEPAPAPEMDRPSPLAP